TDAYFLDFDGTLADLVDDPDAAYAPPGFCGVLTSLSRACGGALAIVSGRPVACLDRRLPAGLWRVGGHGAEIAAPGEPAPPPRTLPDTLVEAARFLEQSYPGVRIETKSTGLAVHFRAARHAESACREALRRAVAADHRFVLQEGKCVVEARPAGADKGTALETLMRRAPFKGRRPLAIGDDVTDAAMMRAAKALGGEAFAVGADMECARARFAAPVELRAWLACKLGPPARGPQPGPHPSLLGAARGAL
ncbi:MAG: trehalose-phosphatase, partial [Oceanicaulis sp.]